MALDVGEFQVHLVEDNGLAAFLVHDGIDSAGQHPVGTRFLMEFLGGFFGSIPLLVGHLVTKFGAFGGIGDKVNRFGIQECAFHILDEGFDTNVFVALVADLANHDCRGTTHFTNHAFNL